MKKNSATLVIQVADRTEIERLLAILHLGLCTAIEQGVLPITSAEDYLYSPYTLEQLETLGVSPQSLRLVHLGTELEDVASLLPEKLQESLVEIKQAALTLLQTLPYSPGAEHQWVQAMPTATNGKLAPAPAVKIFAAPNS
jgi:hypothetical protein